MNIDYGVPKSSTVLDDIVFKMHLSAHSYGSCSAGSLAFPTP